MTKWKMTKGQTTIYKTLHRKLKIDQHDPLKAGSELMCSTMGCVRHVSDVLMIVYSISI